MLGRFGTSFLVALVLLPPVAWLSGCASASCGFLKTGGDPLVELAYVAAGDGGPVTILRLYSGAYRDPSVAVLEMEPLGRHRRCRKIAGPGVSDLKEALQGRQFENLWAAELAKGNDIGVHKAFLGVRHHDAILQRRPSIVAPEFLEALVPIELLFRREFPSLTRLYLPYAMQESVTDIE